MYHARETGVNGAGRRPETIDQAGVLLVGVLKWNANDEFAAQLDVVFLSTEGDRWIWKALEDPWSEDAKGPEPR